MWEAPSAFCTSARRTYNARETMASAYSISSTPICRERVMKIEAQQDPVVCVFGNQTKLFLSRFLAKYLAIGDEIAFSVPTRDAVGAEIFITKTAASGPNRYLYQAPIGYVSQPKQDKRSQHFVSAEVRRGNLGMGAVFLPCEVFAGVLLSLAA
jgi:hypothetical protein